MRPGSRIMYLEFKGRGIEGPGRIGRVTWSKSGRSVYYRGRRFAALVIRGYKANYCDAETLEDWWISGPRRDGGDRLHGGIVEIDDDARAEYWTAIRGLPRCVHLTRYRC